MTIIEELAEALCEQGGGTFCPLRFTTSAASAPVII